MYKNVHSEEVIYSYTKVPAFRESYSYAQKIPASRESYRHVLKLPLQGSLIIM